MTKRTYLVVEVVPNVLPLLGSSTASLAIDESILQRQRLPDHVIIPHDEFKHSKLVCERVPIMDLTIGQDPSFGLSHSCHTPLRTVTNATWTRPGLPALGHQS